MLKVEMSNKKILEEVEYREKEHEEDVELVENLFHLYIRDIEREVEYAYN